MTPSAWFDGNLEGEMSNSEVLACLFLGWLVFIGLMITPSGGDTLNPVWEVGFKIGMPSLLALAALLLFLWIRSAVRR